MRGTITEKYLYRREMPMDQYFLLLNGEQKGPFTMGQLRSMWTSGGITADILYWQEGNSDWLPITALLSDLEPSTSRASYPVASPPPAPIGPRTTSKNLQPLSTKQPSKNLTPAQTAAGLIGGLVSIAILIYFNSNSSSNQATTQPYEASTQASQETVSAPVAISDISWASLDAIYKCISRRAGRR